MRGSLIIAAALAAIVQAGTTHAASEPPYVTTRVVSDKPTVAIDPTQAYILVRSELALPMHFMKLPSAEDQARYARQRAEALVKAKKRYVQQKGNYDRAVKLAAANGGGSIRVPAKPVEPTEENFDFTAFGVLAGVSMGPINRFAKKEGGGSTYLQAVTPGEYRLYGTVAVVPGTAPLGSCFCMGSVAFTAKAGEITDLGMFQTSTIAAENQPRAGDSSVPPGAASLKPADAAMEVDPRLKGLTITPAKLRPVGKLPNYYGIAISRLPAIDGVMRYDRDRIVDLTAAH